MIWSRMTLLTKREREKTHLDMYLEPQYFPYITAPIQKSTIVKIIGVKKHNQEIN